MEPGIKREQNQTMSAPVELEQNQGHDILSYMLKVYRDATEVPARLEAAVDKLGKVITLDAHPPAAMAQKAEAAGVTKGKLNAPSTIVLGILAGVFIGLGGMFYTVVTTNSGLGFGLTKLVGGLAFCLGLILVVVAGAELFTGNTLITMSWMSGRTPLTRLLRNWGLVYFANLAGGLSLAGLMFYTHQWAASNFGVGANALLIASAKVNLAFGPALVRGILCNALVCLAVWLCFSARTIVDKIAAIIFPITAFVAAGFEHSIANMYFIPMGIMLKGQASVLAAAGVTGDGISRLNWGGFVGNLIPVTLGNIIGGAILIGAIYWVAYLRSERAAELATARPWLKTLIPTLREVSLPKPVAAQLPEAARAQIDGIIRAKLEEPAALDASSKTLLAVLAKARDDSHFLASLAEKPAEALKNYGLTPEEHTALVSGDLKWIESKLGTLDEPLRTLLTARLTQEKW